MKPSAVYLIPRNLTEDLRTRLEIQTQALGRISRSSAESFRYVTVYLKLRYQPGCSNQPWYHTKRNNTELELVYPVHMSIYQVNTMKPFAAINSLSNLDLRYRRRFILLIKTKEVILKSKGKSTAN